MSEAGRSCNETILYPATKAYTRYGGGSENRDSRSHSKVLKSLQMTETSFDISIKSSFLNFNFFSELVSLSVGQ